MNEYFTLYAEFSADDINIDDICDRVNRAWLENMAVLHPTYAEPSTYASIELRENILDTYMYSMNMYIIAITQDKYVRIYKNTY